MFRYRGLIVMLSMPWLRTEDVTSCILHDCRINDEVKRSVITDRVIAHSDAETHKHTLKMKEKVGMKDTLTVLIINE